MNRFNLRWNRLSLLLCLFMLSTAIVYVPGLEGDFEFDDGVNILDNGLLRVSDSSLDNWLNAARSGTSGILGRPLSMVSFAFNYYLSGYSAYAFKLTNVIIHLISGVGVFFLAWQTTRAIAPATREEQSDGGVIAAMAAGAWLLHPLNLTSVLYVVQRMAALSALFVFFAVGTYILGRRLMLSGSHRNGWMLIGLALLPLTGLGLLSKESAVLAPLLMLVVEVTLFRFRSDQGRINRALIVLFAGIFVLPSILLIAKYERVFSYIASGYLSRDFTMMDRLLTQPRVVLFYLQLIFVPRASDMGLYHDDFQISRALFEPSSTFVAMAVLTGLISAGIYTLQRAPVLALGIFWFLGGHLLESTFIPLEMMHEHRNYLPIFGPLYAFFYYLFRQRIFFTSNRFKFVLSIAVIVALGSVTFVRSLQWSNLVDHAAIEAHNHPNSVTANYQMGRLYLRLYLNDPNVQYRYESEKFFRRSAELSNYSVFPLVGLVQLLSKAGEQPAPLLLETMKARLAKVDWSPNLDAIGSLVNCQIQYYCQLPHESVLALLQASISNPKAGPKSLGSANSLMGNYLAIKLQDLTGARRYLVAAVEAEKDRLSYRLDLVGLLVALGEFDEARRQLTVARQIDKFNASKSRLDAEEQMIAKMAGERKN